MPPNLAARNCFFVNYVGTDDPGYNAIGSPWSYKTLGEALIALAGVANPPSASNPWTIAIGPCVQTESGFELPPWVFITGSADAESGQATELDLTGDITLHPAWANGAARGGLANMILRPASGSPRLELVMPAPASGNPSRIVELENIRTNLTVSNFEGTGTGDVFRFAGVVQDGADTNTFNLIGGTFQVSGASLAASLTAADTSGLGLTATLESVFLGAGSSLSVTIAHNASTLELLASQFPSATIDQTGGSLAIAFDAVSWPVIGNVSITGTATLSRLSDANAVGYSPSTPANWVTVPDTVQEALDELAGSTSGESYNLGTLTTAVTIDVRNGINQYGALTGGDDLVITLDNMQDGVTLNIILTGATSASVTWPAAINWANGAAPVQSQANKDFYTLAQVGTVIFGSAVQNMSS